MTIGHSGAGIGLPHQSQFPHAVRLGVLPIPKHRRERELTAAGYVPASCDLVQKSGYAFRSGGRRAGQASDGVAVHVNDHHGFADPHASRAFVPGGSAFVGHVGVVSESECFGEVSHALDDSGVSIHMSIQENVV